MKKGRGAGRARTYRSELPGDKPSLGPPKGAKAGDEYYLHVDEETGEEFYFRRSPHKLPVQWITIEHVGDDFVDETAHTDSFYRWQRPDLDPRFDDLNYNALIMAIPHGEGWLRVCDTVVERKRGQWNNGPGVGVLWRRRQVRQRGGG